MSKKVLIISEGPPPLGDTHAEGGALRAWGLAKGLAFHGFIVTFAYRSTFKVADNAYDADLPDKIKVKTWDGTSIHALLEKNSIVVMRYAMGEARQIVERLQPKHILVSDSYIPISVEVAARKSDDKYENENFLRLQKSSAIAAKRADYFLYASPVQKIYYLGYFAALNKLNPLTYEQLESRMFEVPYGVDPTDQDKKLLLKKANQPTLLWYGAFYSWFDMESLIDSFKRLKEDIPSFKLLIAGAKNPYNKDPGILAHYEKTMRSLEPLGDTVEYISWHPYDQRFAVYSQATAIITWNHLGLENQLAWRTRLMDFVLSNKPIITNGGDPLGEDLISRGVAFRADTGSVDKVFKKIIEGSPAGRIFNEAAERYSWNNITKDLAKELNRATNMPIAKMDYRVSSLRTALRRVKLALSLPWKFAKSVGTDGFGKTATKSSRFIKSKVKNG